MLSFSVATTTRFPISSGCPYTAPSSRDRQATASVPGGATPGAIAVRAKFWPYVGQEEAGKAAAARAEAGIAATAPPAGTPIEAISAAAVSTAWRVTVRASDLIVPPPKRAVIRAIAAA